MKNNIITHLPCLSSLRDGLIPYCKFENKKRKSLNPGQIYSPAIAIQAIRELGIERLSTSFNRKASLMKLLRKKKVYQSKTGEGAGVGI